MKQSLTLESYIEGFKKKDRSILARAITLIESSNSVHQEMAQKLIHHLLPQTGGAKRIGISGTPGVGKSSFIEVFGKLITEKQKTIAILAVDPTSKVSGGSILGDKTRMTELSQDPLAFIRPSPSGDTLGGVARRTRETILLCEAFGFDYVLVETVGVGQSETTVAQMVDVFVMLLQPGSGDDLQGIKRGILELVDLVVVTKDDGDSRDMIKKAKHDYSQALQILRHDDGIPEVFSCSSMTKTGFNEILSFLENYFKSGSQKIKIRREKQGVDWMWQLIHEALLSDFHASVSKEKIDEVSKKLLSSILTAPQAAEELVSSLRSHLPK